MSPPVAAKAHVYC